MLLFFVAKIMQNDKPRYVFFGLNQMINRKMDEEAVRKTLVSVDEIINSIDID